VRGQSIKGKYDLLIEAVRPDKRRRDIGNLEKAVSDILQAAKIIEDDYLCQDLHMRWVKTGPECLITVRIHDGEAV
jgi:Holliday junction resolvase RusA-like endonuclease